jgi:hypothetical protein
MKTALRYLVAAAAITAAVPTVSLARPCDEDRPVPAPARAAYDAGWRDPDGWRNDRHEGWRETERARLRVEYARLDRARQDFYAHGGRNRWKAARFERWYAEERAGLDRQWNALSWVAGR